MSFLSIITAAERWIASLFSGASEIETAVATVKADPILAGAATAAQSVVTDTLTKAGLDASKIEATGAEILSKLSAVAADVPTVLAAGEKVIEDITTHPSATAPAQPAA